MKTKLTTDAVFEGQRFAILAMFLLCPTSRKRSNLVRVFHIFSIGFHSLVLGMAKRRGTSVVKVSFWSLVILLFAFKRVSSSCFFKFKFCCKAPIQTLSPQRLMVPDNSSNITNRLFSTLLHREITMFSAWRCVIPT